VIWNAGHQAMTSYQAHISSHDYFLAAFLTAGFPFPYIYIVMIGRGKPAGPVQPFSFKWKFFNQKQLLMSHQKLLLIKKIIFLLKKSAGDGKTSLKYHYPYIYICSLPFLSLCNLNFSSSTFLSSHVISLD
jgi:hypothetical protein